MDFDAKMLQLITLEEGRSKMDLSKYDDNELKIAITNLSKHVNNKDAFSLEKLNAGLGPEIKGDLSRKMYRRSYFKDCIFDSTICKSIGFSGSKFISTVFKNCDLTNGNLHSCDFRNVSFEGRGIDKFRMKNAGFHKSTFTDCTFQNLHIFSCGFTDAVFYNTTFLNCIIKLSSFENAQFKNCQFINVNLSTLNIEYAEFDNIYASCTIFPFITIPSAFGLLQQLPLLEDNNSIYSADKTKHNLSISEYMSLLKDFELFYYKRENYYALSNIYISMNKISKAYETITAGILIAIKTRDYRILHHFCRLVYLSNMFTLQQRRNLFENITLWVTDENLSISEFHNYQMFMGPIRELLLNNNHNKPTLYFYLKTNINPNEQYKQVILLSVLDEISNFCNISSSSIELRHNSAYIDFLTIICDDFLQFSQALIMIYSSLAGIGLFAAGVRKVVDAAQNTVLNHDKHITNKLEQEKLKLEISSNRQEQEYREKMHMLEYNKAVLELQKLNFELENMQVEANKHKQILLENDIKISVGHTSRNLRSAPIPEMMQYN